MSMVVAIDRTPKHTKDRRARRILGRYGWRVAPRTWIITSEAALGSLEEESRRQLSGEALILLVRTRKTAETLLEHKEIRGSTPAMSANSRSSKG